MRFVFQHYQMWHVWSSEWTMHSALRHVTLWNMWQRTVSVCFDICSVTNIAHARLCCVKTKFFYVCLSIHNSDFGIGDCHCHSAVGKSLWIIQFVMSVFVIQPLFDDVSYVPAGQVAWCFNCNSSLQADRQNRMCHDWDDRWVLCTVDVFLFRTHTYVWFQDSTIKYLGTAVFWVIAQWVVVISYWHFGTN